MAGQSKVSRQRLRDKKIIIYGKTTVEDADGYETATFAPLHNGSLWAYVRQLSQNEIFERMRVSITEDTLFLLFPGTAPLPRFPT